MKSQKPHPIRVLHPWLLAVFPILFLYAHNIDQVPFRQIPLPASVVLIVSAVMWLILRAIVRNRYKAGMLLSLGLIYFFSYGHFYHAVQGWEAAGLRIGINTYMLPAWAIPFLVAAVAVLKTHKPLQQFTRVLNIAGLSLVVLPLLSIGGHLVRPAGDIETDVKVSEFPAIPMNVTRPAVCPDIYFIILDGYSRSDILKEIFNYDNSEMLDFLSQRGFYVVSRAQSNYMESRQSIRATLNLDYLNKQIEQLSSDNRVFRFLKEQDYTTIAFASGYVPTELQYADVYLSPGFSLNDFEMELINTTPLAALYKLRKVLFHLRRKRVFYTLDNISDLPAQESPFIVFAHIMCPHPPFIFGRDGQMPVYKTFTLTADTDTETIYGSLDRYFRLYGDQVEFLNLKVRETIDRILARPGNRPIIIIQADHGNRHMVDWKHPEQSDLKSPFCIFSACYFPDGDYSRLNESLSSVNTFRVVFNQFFGTDYALLKNETYFSKSRKHQKVSDVIGDEPIVDKAEQ